MMKEIGIIKAMLSDDAGNVSSMRGMSWTTLFAAIGYVGTCLGNGTPVELSVLLALLGAAFGGKAVQKFAEMKKKSTKILP